MKSSISFSNRDRNVTEQGVDLFRDNGALFLENAFPKDLIERVAETYADKYQSMSKKELRKRDAVVGDRRYMVTVDIKKPFNDPELYALSLIHI